MPVSEVLNSFRKSGYVDKKPQESDSSGARSIKLTDDEAKALQGYGEGGEEATCEVTGRLNGAELSVISVRPLGGAGNEKAMAEEMMGKMAQAPVMRPQTMPSPS